MSSLNDQDRNPERIDRRRVVLSLLGAPLYFVLFMFLPAGTWAWAKGWLFVLVALGIVVFALCYLWRVNPDVVVARSRLHKGTKRWDKILLCFFFSFVYAIIPVAALDDSRFQWFPCLGGSVASVTFCSCSEWESSPGPKL